MRRDLRGRVCVVTGASRGIGRRTAETLAKHGAKLALVARSAEDLQALAEKLRGQGVECEAYPTDITDPEARNKTVTAIVSRFGGLDVLINSAGTASFAEFVDSTPEILRRITEINFFASVEMIRLCQPHLLQSSLKGRKSGWRAAILNVASTCGRVGIPSFSEHCGSKHAITGFSEAIRLEFAQYDIDVLLVHPSLVKTDDSQKHYIQNRGKVWVNFENAVSADYAGERVVKALVRNWPETAVGRDAWWALFGKRAGPRFVRAIMRRKVRNFAARQQ
ncbi:MAG: SDR family NAD(P)-dependent oxidoreductase [Fimbriiglobus sp.]